MKGLSLREWWNYVSPIISTLIFALITWAMRKNVWRGTWQQYAFVVWLVLLLLYVVMTARLVFLQTTIPLAFRVIHFLCLALLVITSIAAWPRKKT